MKRPVVIAVAVAVVAVGVLVATVSWLSGRSDEPAPAASPSSSAEVSVTAPVDVSPPVDEDAPNPPADEGAPPGEPHEATSTIPGAVAVVTLAVWDARGGVVLVGGFVSGIAEDGGTCRFTVSAMDTGDVKTIEVSAAMNVDTTTCGSHEVGAPASQTAEYTVKMEYTNAIGSASSSPIPVEES